MQEHINLKASSSFTHKKQVFDSCGSPLSQPRGFGCSPVLNLSLMIYCRCLFCVWSCFDFSILGDCILYFLGHVPNVPLSALSSVLSFCDCLCPLVFQRIISIHAAFSLLCLFPVLLSLLPVADCPHLCHITLPLSIP